MWKCLENPRNFFLCFRQKLKMHICWQCYEGHKYSKIFRNFQKMAQLLVKIKFIIFAKSTLKSFLLSIKITDVAILVNLWVLNENPPNNKWEKKSAKLNFDQIKIFRKHKSCKMCSLFQIWKNNWIKSNNIEIKSKKLIYGQKCVFSPFLVNF